MDLRWYQTESVNSFWGFLCANPKKNPVVVIPTGGGKSLIIAKIVQDAVQTYQGRVICLAHRKELLEQNAAEIVNLLPDLDIGIYSAGLKSRDTEHDVVLAGIQSCYSKAHIFGARQLVIVDECHLIPVTGEGMYRTFLQDLQKYNPVVRLGGLTATPFRLDCGPLCGPDRLFHKVAFSAPVKQLVDEGYLCRIDSRAAESEVDTSGLRLSGGEFVEHEMQTLFGEADKVERACLEIVQKTQRRHSVLVFCSGVMHAEYVCARLKAMSGAECAVVVGSTDSLERASTLANFKAGHVKYLCNCDVLTTGFNAPNIDAIAVLRATMSPGLFAQIVGRGFRVHPTKDTCLILDFGQNIKRHGPLDDPDYGLDVRRKGTGEKAGEVPCKECPNCREEILIQARICPFCDFIFTSPEKKARHEGKADEESDLLKQPAKPVIWDVHSVFMCRHRKKNAEPGTPDTLRVDYECSPEGMGGNLAKQNISEWVCLEHPPGFAHKKACQWWGLHSTEPVPASIDEALFYDDRDLLRKPTQITTIQEGRFHRITDRKLAPLEDRGDSYEPPQDDFAPQDHVDYTIPF